MTVIVITFPPTTNYLVCKPYGSSIGCISGIFNLLFRIQITVRQCEKNYNITEFLVLCELFLKSSGVKNEQPCSFIAKKAIK